MRKLSLKERLKAPTPILFKKIKKVGAILTVISVILLAGNSQFDLGFPPIIDKIGQIIAYGGFIAASIASLTVDESKLKEENEEHNIHKKEYEPH